MIQIISRRSLSAPTQVNNLFFSLFSFLTSLVLLRKTSCSMSIIHLKPCPNEKRLVAKDVDVVPSGQTVTNMFYHRPNKQTNCFTMFDQLFDVLQILLIKHDPTLRSNNASKRENV